MQNPNRPNPERIWSVPLAVEEIPETGKQLELNADETARKAIADIADVRALPRFSATFDVKRHGSGVHVSGRVNAKVDQTCVVTLEPMQSEIEEAIDLLFLPPEGEAAEPAAPAKRAKADKEPPEPLIGGVIDLGQVATEFLLLAIDPYPRKPGAEFVAPKTDVAGVKPFAALEALKKGSKSGQT